MQILRRAALLGAGAAAVTGATVAPLAVEPLLAMRYEWVAINAEIAAEPAEDDADAANWDRKAAVESRILTAEPQTLLGALIQIEIWAGTMNDGGPADFVRIIADDIAEQVSTRIKGLAGTTEDAAFFDALAEYDRLAAISQDLERRAEVFRPGIPEAEEATKAYDAAYDEAMEAWAKAREIPITTQAGLCAKLQAMIRFMADLGEGELWEAEWNAIKADTQRITGEAST